jgi:cytidylate kinase-like protein
MAIVTISQQLGSGGIEIGMAVADRLGYRFVDHKLGGQWLLRDVPHVVRARVVAPAGVRATELLTVLSEQGGERIGAHVGARMVGTTRPSITC